VAQLNSQSCSSDHFGSRFIDDERRTPDLKLALALQIGFLRMTGRLLVALRVVPPALWRRLAPVPERALNQSNRDGCAAFLAKKESPAAITRPA